MSARSETLRELVALALERLDAGDGGAVEALCAEHPELAPRLRARLDALQRAGLIEPASTDDAFPERLAEFRIVERVGGGGMGVVFRAVQESLGREVALKVVRSDLLFFPGSRERFRREVETVARLQHPGIVPIYTVGEDGGVPYFAMELVRGCTLAEALDHLAGRAPHRLRGADLAEAVVACSPGAGARVELVRAGSLFQGGWAETCFRVAQAVADALQHVHEQGVLHLDIKPSNIMITATGRVMLLDFGLASGGGDRSLTRTGSQLGSLPYMSPEQLDGRIELDVRSDVYSLGVTLYELLTLRSPYAASSFEHTHERILAGAPVSVREWNRAVSWEMETVCLTAFDRDRERRYATTDELACDLGNALQARPLLARRPGPWLRARRFLQRHPTGSAAALVATLLLTVAASAFGLFERDARQRVEEQRRLALANLGDARAAVDRMLTRVSEGVLAETPYMEEVRRRLLEDALEFYATFLERHGDEPELRFESGRTFESMGRVQALLGRAVLSREAYGRARETYDALVADFPAVRKYRLRHAASLRALAGSATFHDNDYDTAQALLDEALTALDALRAEDPADAGLALELAETRASRAALFERMALLQRAEDEARAAVALLAELGDEDPAVLAGRVTAAATLAGVLGARTSLAEARRRYEEAIDWLERLVDVSGPSVARRARLAQLRLDLTVLLFASQVRDGTEEACERTLEAFRELVAEHPRVPAFRTGLARALLVRKNLFVEEGNHDGAEGALLEVVAVIGELRDAFPGEAEHQRRLAEAHEELAKFRESRGRHEESSAAIAKTLSLYDELVRSHPDVPTWRSEKAGALNTWGCQQLDAGRTDEAAEAFLAALAIAEELVADYPDSPDFADRQTRFSNNVGLALEADEPERAEKYFRFAVDSGRALVASYPERLEHLTALASASTSLGIFYEDRGAESEDPEEAARLFGLAERQYHEVIELREQLLRGLPDQPDYLADHGTAQQNLASVYERLGRDEEALALLEGALDSQRAALAINPDHPWYRSFLRIHTKLQTQILLSLGRYEEALPTTAEYLTSVPEDPGTHAIAALFYANCAFLAGQDESLSEDERAERTETLCTRAEDALVRAHELGFARRALPDPESEVWSALAGRERFERSARAIEAAAGDERP